MVLPHAASAHLASPLSCTCAPGISSNSLFPFYLYFVEVSQPESAKTSQSSEATDCTRVPAGQVNILSLNLTLVRVSVLSTFTGLLVIARRAMFSFFVNLSTPTNPFSTCQSSGNHDNLRGFPYTGPSTYLTMLFH